MSNGACSVWPEEKWGPDRKAWPALWIDGGHARRISLRKTIRALQIEDIRGEVCICRRKDLAGIRRIVQNGQEGEMWKIHGRPLKRSCLKAVFLGRSLSAYACHSRVPDGG